jgi:hypothetical protein
MLLFFQGASPSCAPLSSMASKRQRFVLQRLPRQLLLLSTRFIQQRSPSSNTFNFQGLQISGPSTSTSNSPLFQRPLWYYDYFCCTASACTLLDHLYQIYLSRRACFPYIALLAHTVALTRAPRLHVCRYIKHVTIHPFIDTFPRTDSQSPRLLVAGDCHTSYLLCCWVYRLSNGVTFAHSAVHQHFERDGTLTGNNVTKKK